MECDFLKIGLLSLVKGEVLAYVILTTTVSYDLVMCLIRHFPDIRVWCFGDEGPAGFNAFEQIVILGVKRWESLRQSDIYTLQHRDTVNVLIEQCDERYSYRHGECSVKEALPTALREGVLYNVPVVRKAARLRRYRYTGAASN